MKKKTPKAFVVVLPPVPKNCSKCGRPVGGSINSDFNKQYGPWCVPVTDMATGKTQCSMCEESAHGDLDTRALPPESRKALNRYRAMTN